MFLRKIIEQKVSGVFSASWTLEALNNKTKVTLRGVFLSAEARDHLIKTYNAVEGVRQTLGRLADYLAAKPVFEF